MVGKARSSNFTVTEKLDLLNLVKPYVGVLEQHTNKHSVIVEKNKCWEIVADKYNAMGTDRPPRTAQGLRTLYKRLKEYAKQELLQYQKTQLDYESSVSEPTKKLVEMIPQITSVRFIDDQKPCALMQGDSDAGTSSQQGTLNQQTAVVTVEVEQEEDEDVKPPPSLTLVSLAPEKLQEAEEQNLMHALGRSPSPSQSSIDMRISLSPSPIPMREDFFRHQTGEQLRQMCGCDPQALQLLREEHHTMLKNQRKIGLYIQEKRNGLKRRQQLEEELLKVKIKVEMLRAMRLHRDLPEYNSF